MQNTVSKQPDMTGNASRRSGSVNTRFGLDITLQQLKLKIKGQVRLDPQNKFGRGRTHAKHVVAAGRTDVENATPLQRCQVRPDPVPLEGRHPFTVQLNAEDIERSLAPGNHGSERFPHGTLIVRREVLGLPDPDPAPVQIDIGGIDIGQVLQHLQIRVCFAVIAVDSFFDRRQPVAKRRFIGRQTIARQLRHEGVLHFWHIQEQKLNHFSQMSRRLKPALLTRFR